jgi:hypothetical protein
MMLHYVQVAMGKERLPSHKTWTYFCGCCWRGIDKLQAEAVKLAKSEGEPEPVPAEEHDLSTVLTTIDATLWCWLEYKRDRLPQHQVQLEIIESLIKDCIEAIDRENGIRYDDAGIDDAGIDDGGIDESGIDDTGPVAP